MVTTITNVRIFDGGVITDVGAPAKPGATLVDGAGATLLPGLIDAHVGPLAVARTGLASVLRS